MSSSSSSSTFSLLLLGRRATCSRGRAASGSAAATAATAAAKGLKLRETGSDHLRSRLAIHASQNSLKFLGVVGNPSGLQDLLDVLRSGRVVAPDARHSVRGDVFHPHGGLADMRPAANPRA